MFKAFSKPGSKTGMTLIELMVVMGIMGILFAAVYMFFVKGTEQFHFTRQQNILATDGKLALETISDKVLWAGYMPQGGWTEDEWDPVELGSTESFQFYADFEGDKSLDDNDHIQIFRDTENRVHITDNGVMDRIAGSNIISMQFNYLDETGGFLAKPLDEGGREAVRHIIIKLTLQSSYMGDVYQTVMQTMVTPRNLGVYHNFDPLFYMPPPPDAKIVVNVNGDSLAHAPTADQTALLNMLNGWGFTLVDLTDDELETYDYDSSGVDLIILREMSGAQSHSGMSATLQGIRLPIIALDPDDAKDVFGMGNTTAELAAGVCTLYEQVANHPIHDDLPSPFNVYDGSPSTHVYTLTDLTPGTELITGFVTSDILSGVSVVNQEVDSLRRIHYCAGDFSKYSSNGAVFLQNVILWGLPEEEPPDLGENITLETFEGGSPGEVAVTMWEDDLEGGSVLPDSVALYRDLGVGPKGMTWTYQSTGSGRVALYEDTLRMDRNNYGVGEYNGAFTSVDLSAYDEHTDDLYLTVNSNLGLYEAVDPADGVYFVSGGTTTDRIGIPSSLPGWQRIDVDLDEEAVANSVPFSGAFGIALGQYGTGPWPYHGIEWRWFELGIIKDRYSVPGWHHEPSSVGDLDDWLLEDVSGNHKWTLHANDPTKYSNDSDCWLETPSIVIPAGTIDALFSFSHSVDFGSGYDYGWLEITTDNGATWNFLDTSSYNGSGVYTGTFGTTTVNVPLDNYIGETVRVRFVFHSDYSVVKSGWVLDDFAVTGTVSGLVIQSIGFKPVEPSGAWYFEQVHVYLGSTAEASFGEDGEWDTSTLTDMGSSYEVGPAGDWVTIDLDENYLMPASGNLIVKIETFQYTPTVYTGWYAGYHHDMTRGEISDSADPTFLYRSDMRPAFMIGTMNNGQIFVDADSTAIAALMPMSFNNYYSDFEGIYTPEEFGFGAETNWTSGGSRNDWEIDAPVFVPDIDPYLTSQNENKIAGNDLTDDGYYMADAWNWLASGAYSMSDFTMYDTLSVSYDRCLRLDWSDYAYIQMAFTTDSLPPVSGSDWITVKECHYEDDAWVQDYIPLTFYFDEAESQGKQYFFIRFVLDSGPWSELGGWNIDNIGFYGRYAY